MNNLLDYSLNYLCFKHLYYHFFAVCTALLLSLFILSGGNIRTFDTLSRLAVKPVFVEWAWLPAVLGLFAALRWLYVNKLDEWSHFVADKLYDRQASLLAGIAPPKVSGIPLLSITAMADEAGALLRFARASTELVISGGFSIALKLMFAFVVIPALITMALIMGPMRVDDSNDVVFVFASAVILSLFLAPFVYGVCLLPTILFPRIYSARLFGDEKILDHCVIATKSEEYLQNWSPYEHFSPNYAKPWRVWKGLHHSQVYLEAATIKQIVSWIDLTARAGPMEKEVIPPLTAEERKKIRMTILLAQLLNDLKIELSNEED